MPEVTVRKRVGKRSGGWKYKVRRWYYRNRPQVAVTAAFAVVVLLSIIVIHALVPNLGTSEPSSTSAAAPPQ